MSVFAGPKIQNDGFVFYIDAQNITSFSGNGLTNMITGEVQYGSLQSTDDYIYTQPKGIGSYTIQNLENYQDIAVYTRIRHNQAAIGIKGAVFSINIPHNQNDLQTATPLPHTIFTSNVTNIIGYSNNTIASNTINVSPHTIFTSNGTNIIGYSNNTIASNTINVSPHTIFTSNVSGNVGYSNNTIASNTINVSPHTIFTSNVVSIHNYYFNNSHELSLFADDSGVIVRNKMPLYDITISYGVLKNSDNSYVINFSLGTVNKKIELYINNINVLNTDIILESGVVVNSAVQLFSIAGQSDYLMSGIKNLIIYNKRLTQDDVNQFQNLRGN